MALQNRLEIRVKKDFRKRLNRGDVLVGTLITLPSAEVAEIMAEVGFDWLFIDTEHSPFNAYSVQTILQAETAQAVKNISEIVKVPGIDAIFIGPYDLSASLGKMGQLADPEVKQAIETIAQACKKAGVRLGIFAATAEAVAPFIQQDFTLLAVGTDGLHMAQSAREVLKTLRP
jgi:2-keto-3-deoxy-L-rhamnonate aldolase RhmA